MARISTDQPSSSSDLKVTFEANGESVAIYIDAKKVNDSNRASIFSELSCALCCSQKSGFAACVARCLLDNQCCDGGVSNCTPVP